MILPFEHNYTIGVVSQMFQVTPETIRLYEKEGLILPKRSESGQRRYSELDIAWISCIRKLITEDKLNLAGIRHLLALIPCWEMKPCTESERTTCAAYQQNDQPCWNLKQISTLCQEAECYQCIVYRSAQRVGNIKDFIALHIKNISSK
ncbi:MAG: MerR family transcriptional regulator [Candidatus Marinimicrobia bacterium]|jgi:MerR family transcriptional regulator/heat shock protein HspR|nr:MerR family transcriptional regulator [Candidatus Neomarinimicrobiota bacterium]MBT3634329.1 MerR family transcriptional regulator [Candidatus Neomarinimicrobiota bacterium]MBT3681762.1 MerR family transcriptional regulator [Candidatus Neomarinimicrobiota bacterium]MBT3759488.1 MerR family transcriptional regulator [Candidatus Neomarinimicrobiota bacterium]MBT4171853.1 MerR family transcriptional regulator [Candidatus Neomarinimicrobiota bacterium]